MSRATSGEPAPHLSASVVVAAYTLDRWTLLVRCMDSVLAQTRIPEAVVLCIDNNEDLYVRAHDTWASTPGVVVMRNPDVEHVNVVSHHEKAHGTKRRFGAGSARNAGVQATQSDVVAIIDDDAHASADWLEKLLSAYGPDVAAVGGPPLPDYETARPTWFPRSFDWVFGCAYEGLPTKREPLGHLIGANMSFRRSAFDEVGGFGSIDFDDLDLCMRLGHAFGHDALLFEPKARVRHFVPGERVTWRYFWRRCLYVNTEKVEAFADMAEAANLRAEIGFALRTSTVGVGRELTRVLRGDLSGFLAAGAIYVGLACAALGNLRGRIRLAAQRRK